MIYLFSNTNKNAKNTNIIINKNKNLDKKLSNYIKETNQRSFDTFSKKIHPSLLSYKNYSSDFSYVSNSKTAEKLEKVGCICGFSEFCNFHSSKNNSYYENNNNKNNNNDNNNDNNNNNNNIILYFVIGSTTTIVGLGFGLYFYYNKFLYNI
jgi:hypothetical protein